MRRKRGKVKESEEDAYGEGKNEGLEEAGVRQW